MGPSAHSYEGGRRWWNLRKADDYNEQVSLGKKPIEEQEQLSPQDIVHEALMLQLRTRRGIVFKEFEQLTGLTLLPENQHLFDTWQREGLVELSAEGIRPTSRGLAVADGLPLQVKFHGDGRS